MIPTFATSLTNRKLIYVLDMPSFQRDFASLKTLDHGTGPAITFTRASGATYFDADGVLQTAANDTPRFDHDPLNGNSLGLLVEGARTNLHRYSEDFTAGWTATTDSAITSESVTGPAGATTVGKFVFTSTAADNSKRLFRSADITTVSGTEYTYSVWLKALDWQYVIINISASTAVVSVAASSRFDLVNGTIFSTASGSATIQSFGNGWYRCSVTSSGNTITGMRPKVILVREGDGAAEFVAGDIGAGVYVWGAQLEGGAFPTSYIPTTASATATRAAETPVVTPVSSFYNQAEGTMFVEASVQSQGAGRSVFVFNDDSDDNRKSITLQDSAQMNVVSGGVSSASLDGGTISASNKIAGAYKVDDFALSLNGGSVATDTSGVLPVGVTRAYIGYRGTGVDTRTNGHIRKVAYWPKRLTDTLLEQLTT